MTTDFNSMGRSSGLFVDEQAAADERLAVHPTAERASKDPEHGQKQAQLHVV